MAQVSPTTPATCTTALADLGYHVMEPIAMPDGSR